MTVTLGRVSPPCAQGPDSYHYGEDAWLTSSASFNPYQCDFAKLEVCVGCRSILHPAGGAFISLERLG